MILCLLSTIDLFVLSELLTLVQSLSFFFSKGEKMIKYELLQPVQAKRTDIGCVQGNTISVLYPCYMPKVEQKQSTLIALIPCSPNAAPMYITYTINNM